MSVDILPPNSGHTIAQYPVNVNDTRRIDSRARRKLADPNNRINMVHFDPNYIIYDSTTDTTYLRGRLLGKVSNIQTFQQISIYFFFNFLFQTLLYRPPSMVNYILYTANGKQLNVSGWMHGVYWVGIEFKFLKFSKTKMKHVLPIHICNENYSERGLQVFFQQNQCSYLIFLWVLVCFLRISE